jgi:hypothetical protein NreA
MKKNQKVITTLKKARTHINKIIEMIKEEEYCIDIIQQLNAIEGYITSARTQKLRDHLKHCFAEGMKSKSKAKKQRLIDEVLQVTKISK